jgi:hypothetical protein
MKSDISRFYVLLSILLLLRDQDYLCTSEEEPTTCYFMTETDPVSSEKLLMIEHIQKLSSLSESSIIRNT